MYTSVHAIDLCWTIWKWFVFFSLFSRLMPTEYRYYWLACWCCLNSKSYAIWRKRVNRRWWTAQFNLLKQPWTPTIAQNPYITHTNIYYVYIHLEVIRYWLWSWWDWMSMCKYVANIHKHTQSVFIFSAGDLHIDCVCRTFVLYYARELRACFNVDDGARLVHHRFVNDKTMNSMLLVLISIFLLSPNIFDCNDVGAFYFFIIIFDSSRWKCLNWFYSCDQRHPAPYFLQTQE